MAAGQDQTSLGFWIFSALAILLTILATALWRFGSVLDLSLDLHG